MTKSAGAVACALLLACWPGATVHGQSNRPAGFRLDAAPESLSLVPSNSISHLTVDGGSIYVGTGRGLGRSDDGGRSWLGYRSDPAFANDGIFSIATAGLTVWTSTGYEKPITDGTVQTGSGYTYTTDGGLSWHHRDQTLDRNGDSIISYGINDSLRILPVIVPEQNVTFDISLTGGTVWIASWASGLRKSTDFGQTWQRLLLPPDDLNSLSPYDTLWSYAPADTLRLRRIFRDFDPRKNFNFLAFSVYAIDQDTIWCGTAGGINKSTDGGLSWIRFNHQNELSPILGNWVIAIRGQILPSGIRRIWTTNWKANDPAESYGVSTSDDGGRTWRNLLRGTKAYDFAFKDSITYIASDDGIFRTSDGGSSFTGVSTFSDPPDHQFIPPVSVYAVDVIGDTVYAGTGDGFVSTIDNAAHPFGSEWTIRRTYEQVGTGGASYAYPNPFSPALGQVRIHYGAEAGGTGSQSVKIQIFDFGMNRVRTLLHDAQRSPGREYDELWDGTTDGGTIVANGVYFYRIDIGSEEPLYGKILVIQ